MQIEHFDVVIVGAGISGIDAARHLRKECPRKSFILLERRATYGGTWDLFKYPGLRSDSSMCTFGYGSKPWKSAKKIAPAEEILHYLQEAMVEGGIEEHVRYGHQITHAAWSSASALWSLKCENGVRVTCNFLVTCTGYYDHDKGFEPEFAGRERFEAAGGQIVHPQKWRDDVSYAGKRVVVIGSGATAITVVPAMAKDASHVTMLQRSPTYIIPAANVDSVASCLSGLLPSRFLHALVRMKTLIHSKLEHEVMRRRQVGTNNECVIKMMREALPAPYMSDVDFKKHFTPKYNLGEQRPCFDPDCTFFNAIKQRRVSVVTDHIKEFDEHGIVLESGERLDCDVIVTATGLVLQKNQPMASMEVTVDGIPYVATEHMIYKGCMLSGVPNFAFIMGYFNASWTLKADITSSFICRVLKHMERQGFSVCCPQRGLAEMADIHALLTSGKISISSGYILRSLDTLPRIGTQAPWTPLQSYASDQWTLRWKSVEDDVLEFSHLTGEMTC